MLEIAVNLIARSNQRVTIDTNIQTHTSRLRRVIHTRLKLTHQTRNMSTACSGQSAGRPVSFATTPARPGVSGHKATAAPDNNKVSVTARYWQPGWSQIAESIPNCTPSELNARICIPIRRCPLSSLGLLAATCRHVTAHAHRILASCNFSWVVLERA